ncbi:MAG TPA: hypothetical protein VMS86_09600 [Thermoanaerobaculia bacterium]|nr:hypothetical protein [Thermoanaerobaculia bacterium]
MVPQTKAGRIGVLGATSRSLAIVAIAFAAFAAPGAARAEAALDLGEVTYSRDIAPILQRSCQRCHQPDSVAPMSLLEYDQVRPYAKAIQKRTHMGPVAGVMPPWFIERDLGIQHFKGDPSLSEEELAKVARWVQSGAPEGDPADLPPPIPLNDSSRWMIGEPDLVTVLGQVTLKGDAPDWWGEIPPVAIGNTEDRYVAAVEVREINDVLDSKGEKRETVGGRFIFHHMIWSTVLVQSEADLTDDPLRPDSATFTNWPVHEVGRNADFFDPDGARLLSANSTVISNSVHLHSNGRDTTAHLEIGWKFHPKGYVPKYKRALRSFGDAVDIDIKAMEANQQLHAYMVLPEHTKITSFEPHLHAPGARMCLEFIWGTHIETLSCSGYDHNWVLGYEYAVDHEPLLPKGTILHIIGFMDNSPANRNVPDPRNWQGSGNRSVANMFIDLGHGVALSDEQFREAMSERRRKLNLGRNDHVLGCPLCNVLPAETAPGGEATAGGAGH